MSSKSSEILAKMCSINGVAGYESDVVKFLYSVLNENAHLDGIY